MPRRQGNPAILSVGGRRRTGLDGGKASFGTHAAFASFKRDFDSRLQAAGVHQLKPKNLKPKHIDAVLEQLRSDVRTGSRSLGTAKNWVSHLRTFARLIDRRYLASGLMQRDGDKTRPQDAPGSIFGVGQGKWAGLSSRAESGPTSGLVHGNNRRVSVRLGCVMASIEPGGSGPSRQRCGRLRRSGGRR